MKKQTEIFIDDYGETGLDKALGMLEENITHLAQSCFDDFTHENANAAREMGCEAVLIRKQLWNCCEWCASLAGRYNYTKREYPPDVFKRHKLCRCIVTVEWRKGGVQDVWSKKEYASQADAEAARRREIEEEENNEDTLRRLLNIAGDKGLAYADITDYYRNIPKQYPASMNVVDYAVNRDGKEFRHGIDGVKLSREIDTKAEPVAKWYADTFGGEVQLMPRVRVPQTIKTPDMRVINGRMYDIKSPTGSGKWVIDHQAQNLIGQSYNGIIDLTNSPLKSNLPELKRQVNFVMESNDYLEINQLMLVADNKLILVVQRI